MLRNSINPATLMKFLLVFVMAALVVCGCNKNAEKEKQTFSQETCKLRLRMIAEAKQNWASNNQKTANDTPTGDDLRPYLRGNIPKCPDGGVYTIGTVGELPSCSIPEHTAYFKNSQQ
jgi:hypothetical protein